MLDFKPVSLEDRAVFLPILNKAKTPCCDFTFGNLYAWCAAENILACLSDGMLFFRSTIYGVTAYTMPLGESDEKNALLLLQEDARDRNVKLCFNCLCEKSAALLKEHYGDRLTVTEQRAIFDYIYLREDLANLSGRRFHAKKNHYNAFVKNYDFVYEELTQANLEECLAFSREWHKNAKPSPQLDCEHGAVERAFAHFTELGLSGALLRVGGKIVAYTAGEPSCSPRMYCTHFEKALPEIEGSYAAINKLFAERTLGGYDFIDREDDAGSEGLRKAKLSYQPELLLKKYYAELN